MEAELAAQTKNSIFVIKLFRISFGYFYMLFDTVVNPIFTLG
jgi:hypothetical protein